MDSMLRLNESQSVFTPHLQASQFALGDEVCSMEQNNSRNWKGKWKAYPSVSRVWRRKPGTDHALFQLLAGHTQGPSTPPQRGIAEPGRCGAKHRTPSRFCGRNGSRRWREITQWTRIPLLRRWAGEGELPLPWRPIPKNKTWSFTQKSGRT